MKTGRSVILFCVLSLSSLGLVMLWDMDAVIRREHGHASYYFWSQLGWVGLGLTIMILVARLDYARWRRFTLAGLALAMALSFLTAGLGVRHPGMRWGVTVADLPFWPTQSCVMAVVLYLTSYLAYWQERAPKTQASPGRATEPKPSDLYPTRRPLLVIYSAWALLLLATELSAALLLALTALIVLWLGGARRWLVAGACVLTAVGPFFWLRGASMRWVSFTDFDTRRVEAVRCHPMTEIALGHGGWLGVGLGHGRVSRLDDPLVATDFIGTVIGEELGSVTLIGLAVGYVVLVGAGLFVSWKARDNWGFLLGLGIAPCVGIQAWMNLAVVAGLVPSQAPALPFVSYAGMDLVMMLASMGLLLSVAKAAEAGGPADSEKGCAA